MMKAMPMVASTWANSFASMPPQHDALDDRAEQGERDAGGGDRHEERQPRLDHRDTPT